MFTNPTGSMGYCSAVRSMVLTKELGAFFLKKLLL
jgi:hypothetical protein